MSKNEWLPFKYDEFECGLFWVFAVGPEYDGDAGSDGQCIGIPTGETATRTALVQIEEGSNGEPYFDAVDVGNFGDITEEFAVIYYAPVKPPLAPEVVG